MLRLLGRRSIWCEALLAWGALHALLLAVTWLAIRPIGLRRWLVPWTNWDGQPFAQVAAQGYTHPAQAAFYPLYPLLERLVSPLTAGDVALAGVLVSGVASLAVFVLLRVLAERELGRPAARRALLYLLAFPTAFFLLAAYSESLFLALSLGAFLALRAHRWPLTGLLVALAALTRPVGILLLVAVATEVWISTPRPHGAVLRRLTSRRLTPAPPSASALHPAAPCPATSVAQQSASAPSPRTLASAFALPVLALAGYALFIAVRFGGPFTFVSAEGGIWRRSLSWPWQSAVNAASALLTDNAVHRFYIVLDLTCLALVVPLAVLMARRLPPPYVVYTWAMVALVLLVPSYLAAWSALTSDKRFYLMVFPLYLILACLPLPRWVEPCVVVLALLLQCILAATFLQGGWVA
jgi:hypothetical protein